MPIDVERDLAAACNHAQLVSASPVKVRACIFIKRLWLYAFLSIQKQPVCAIAFPENKGVISVLILIAPERDTGQIALRNFHRDLIGKIAIIRALRWTGIIHIGSCFDNMIPIGRKLTTFIL